MSVPLCLFPSFSPPMCLPSVSLCLSLLLCLFSSVYSPLSLPLCLFPSFSSLCLFLFVSFFQILLCLSPLSILLCFFLSVSSPLSLPLSLPLFWIMISGNHILTYCTVPLPHIFGLWNWASSVGGRKKHEFMLFSFVLSAFAVFYALEREKSAVCPPLIRRVYNFVIWVFLRIKSQLFMCVKFYNIKNKKSTIGGVPVGTGMGHLGTCMFYILQNFFRVVLAAERCRQYGL
jgi:hypothetical protein